MSNEDKALQEELAAFELNKPDWLCSHCGEFVVILRTNVIGFYPDFESAFKAGHNVIGLGKNFLVKQVLAVDPVYVIF
jgi:hypothetical protein